MNSISKNLDGWLVINKEEGMTSRQVVNIVKKTLNVKKIGHAGTLISAVLLLFRQKLRMAINRSAEAMTIFGVLQAALFPLLHMGRPWLAYYVFPIPNQFGSLWVNFNSPLLWDVFAISTYFSVSVVFWYIGLIPDFAMIRDRMSATISPMKKQLYSFLSFGWSGKAKHWQRFGIYLKHSRHQTGWMK